VGSIARGLAVGAWFALSCASAEDEPPFSDPEIAGHATNPEGLAYPTDHLGGSARAGMQRGDRIPNFTFQGYRDSNRAGGLQALSLADFYDPGQKHGKVLHLMEAAFWCTICDGQTREMIAAREGVTAEGVVIVQALMNGSRPGTGPSLLELDRWIDRYPTWFSVVVDDRAKRLGSVTDVGAVPWNALIDLRTMEILFAGVGRPLAYTDFAKAGIDWVDTHPPSYDASE
jgi:hypothetical protein